MAVAISAMAPTCMPSLHGSSSRLSRASGAAMSAAALLARKDAQDALFTEEEFQALMSGQCELLSFSSENDGLHQPPSSPPLLSLQLQAQLLCREEDEARFQETPPPFALDDLEAPISDEDIERLAPLFCEDEIQALLCASQQQQQQQQASMMQFSRPRSDDQAGKKRMSSPPWPSCIADDDDEEKEVAGQPPPPPPPPTPPTKKARTETESISMREHEPPPPRPRRPSIKKARTQTKSRSSRQHDAAAARAARLQQRLRKWHHTIATRILMHRFRAPELSHGRTALRCQCPELALADDGGEPRGFGRCALHQDALPGDRAWMYSAQGHAPPLVGGPGEVMVPAVSAGSSKATVRQFARWRRSVSMPTRFYVQHAVEKGLAQQLA